MTTVLTPLATSVHLRGVPLVALAINSVNPSFRVDGEGLRFRVVPEIELAADDIERIGYLRLVGHTIEVLPRVGPFRYGLTFWGEEDARRALSALADLGVPLDEAARRFAVGAAAPA